MAVASDSTPAPSASPLMGISRDRLAEAIERLIAVLDALDGDADLEDGHDAESPLLPFLGAAEPRVIRIPRAAR